MGPTHRKRAVQRRTHQRQHHAGTSRADQPDAPTDHAHCDQTLAQAEQQSSRDDDEIGDPRIMRLQAGDHRDQGTGCVVSETPSHRKLGTASIGEAACIATREDGGEEGDADAEPGQCIAQPQRARDVHGHDGQRHRPRRGRKETAPRQQQQPAQRRITQYGQASDLQVFEIRQQAGAGRLPAQPAARKRAGGRHVMRGEHG